MTYANVLSMKGVHFWTWSSNLRLKVVSRSIINIFAIKGSRGETMATQFGYKPGCTFLVHKVKSFFIAHFVNIIAISWSSKIRFIIMSMVYSSRMEVKIYFTSNDTMFQFWGIFLFLILTIRPFVLLTVYLDPVKGDKSWVKYFAGL